MSRPLKFEIGPVTRDDWGADGKEHRIGFRREWSANSGSTNVEYLTTDELYALQAEIDLYVHIQSRS